MYYLISLIRETAYELCNCQLLGWHILFEYFLENVNTACSVSDYHIYIILDSIAHHIFHFVTEPHSYKTKNVLNFNFNMYNVLDEDDNQCSTISSKVILFKKIYNTKLLIISINIRLCCMTVILQIFYIYNSIFYFFRFILLK